jgi:hypothetical protein
MGQWNMIEEAGEISSIRENSAWGPMIKVAVKL